MREENKAGERLFLIIQLTLWGALVSTASLGLFLSGSITALYHLMFYHSRYDAVPPGRFSLFNDAITRTWRLHVPLTIVMGISTAVLLGGYMIASEIWQYVIVYFFLFELAVIGSFALAITGTLHVAGFRDLIKQSFIAAHVNAAFSALHAVMIAVIATLHIWIDWWVYATLLPLMIIAYFFISTPLMYNALSVHMEE